MSKVISAAQAAALVKDGMAIAREEVFGPVLSVLTFESIERALHIANNTPYGLSAGVWSASIDTCMAVLL